MPKKKNGGRTVAIDMTGVETKVLVPEGDYEVAIDSISSDVGEESGKPYLTWKLRITGPTHEGAMLYHKTSLQPQALFNLKATLLAFGLAVPNTAMKLDLDELESSGAIAGVTIEHETYDGKKKANITNIFPLEDDGADEDDDEPDFDEMGLEELMVFAKENEIDLSGLSKKDSKSADKVRAAVVAGYGEEEEEEEEADEADDAEESDDDDDVNLDEMSLEELVAYAKENEIDLSGLGKKDIKKADKVREVIAAAAGDDEEEDDEEEDDEEEDDDDAPDLTAMDLDELLAYAKANGIKVRAKIRDNQARVLKAIQKSIAGEDEE